jgi:hypothetical protein
MSSSSTSTTTTTVPESLHKLLAETKAREVLPQAWDLLFVNSTDTVGTAFHVRSAVPPPPN